MIISWFAESDPSFLITYKWYSYLQEKKFNRKKLQMQCNLIFLNIKEIINSLPHFLIWSIDKNLRSSTKFYETCILTHLWRPN